MRGDRNRPVSRPVYENEMDDRSDEDLMLAYACGDADAFEVLFGRYRLKLYRLLVRLSGDSALAEDLLQKVFLRMHEARKRYRPEAPFGSWVVCIAYNLWKDELARSHRHHEILAGWNNLFGDNHPALDVEDSPTDLSEQLRRAVLSLPPNQRAVLVLSRYHDMSYAQVAKVLGISTGAVKLKAHRAFERLRVLLVGRTGKSQIRKKCENAL